MVLVLQGKEGGAKGRKIRRGGREEEKREGERERKPILEYGNTELGKPRRYERENRKRKRYGTKRYYMIEEKLSVSRGRGLLRKQV